MAYDFQVITLQEPDKWASLLDEIGRYTIFHHHAFHRLAEIRGDGVAVMPTLRDGRHIIAFPMMLRDVEVPGCEGYKDATSVRGFAGILCTQPTPPEDVRRAFFAELSKYFAQERVVTAFSRLHPLTTEHSILSGYGNVVELGVLLSMDFTIPEEAQLANYRKDHRKQIRRLEKAGFVCSIAGAERLDDIVGIYSRTMERVHAPSAEIVGRDYFEYLLTDMADVTRLFVCTFNDDLAGFKLCGVCGGFMEGYISGTSDKYIEYSPSRILFEAARQYGNQVGVRAIHMGGGVRGQRDSLYEFKAGFATDEHIHCVWQHIADQEAYSALCAAAGCSPSGIRSAFFPAYRRPGAQAEQEVIATQ